MTVIGIINALDMDPNCLTIWLIQMTTDISKATTGQINISMPKAKEKHCKKYLQRLYIAS